MLEVPAGRTAPRFLGGWLERRPDRLAGPLRPGLGVHRGGRGHAGPLGRPHRRIEPGSAACSSAWCSSQPPPPCRKSRSPSPPPWRARRTSPSATCSAAAWPTWRCWLSWTLAYRGRVWHRVSPGHARTAATAIALTAIAVLAIQRPFGLAIGWVGIESIVIFVGYVSLIAWTRRSPTPAVSAGATSHQEVLLARAAPRPARRRMPAPSGLGRARTVAARSADGRSRRRHHPDRGSVPGPGCDDIARSPESAETFVGASFLALATSLPGAGHSPRAGAAIGALRPGRRLAAGQ